MIQSSHDKSMTKIFGTHLNFHRFAIFLNLSFNFECLNSDLAYTMLYLLYFLFVIKYHLNARLHNSIIALSW